MAFRPLPSRACGRGIVDVGATERHHVVIMDKLLDSTPMFLTGNTGTVYAIGVLDLKKDGPTIMEVSPKCGPGTVNDAFFRFVTDMGIAGPDQGQGGKHLILPPDYEGDLNPPEGGMEAEVAVAGEKQKVFVSQSTSYSNGYVMRGFLVDGIQREPASMLEPELLGLFAAIGIEKGKEFNPDERMKKILTDAVAVGNATARAIAFRLRREGTFMEGRKAEKSRPLGPGLDRTL